jgi:hypothetical protein
LNAHTQRVAACVACTRDTTAVSCGTRRSRCRPSSRPGWAISSRSACKKPTPTSTSPRCAVPLDLQLSTSVE